MEKKLAKIIAYAQERLSEEQSGHGFDHACRVAKLAEKIMADLNDPSVDSLVVIAAAYLHDTIDDKVVDDPDEAVEELRNFLTFEKIPTTQVLEILFIIDNLSFSKEQFGAASELTINGQIVQDADRLEALGAIGIMRSAYFGGAHGNVLYDPTIPPRNLQTKAEYREESTVINHFYEKLFLIVDQMKTPFGKQEAQRRKTFMEEFLKEFYREWND